MRKRRTENGKQAIQTNAKWFALSFNDRIREGRLNEHLFPFLYHTCRIIAAWRADYNHHRGSVAQTEIGTRFPLPRTDLPYRLCDRNAKSGVAVEHGDADMDFRDLPVEVPRHAPPGNTFVECVRGGRYPMSFTQCILVSTRLRRWYPLHPLPGRRIRRMLPRGVATGHVPGIEMR